ncbi:MAG: hypothetical protein GOP50_03065 [Candidatus Heimdallarchaeota archaeon]|nr:hypothetical protein [Candidatus Heimdallarchaeota archaeon]
MVLAIINGIFTISAGLITALLWIIVIIKKIDHKFIEKPFERLFHIIAEFIMSVVAIVAGIALLLGQTWSLPLFYVAMGLILYALVNAIGIYKEKKFKLLVIILVISTVITLALIVTSIIVLTI